MICTEYNLGHLILVLLFQVFALDEYFLPSSLLSDYAYVHNCIKLGKDIELQLVKLPSLQVYLLYPSVTVPYFLFYK